MNKEKKILVTHSGKQYVHQLLSALVIFNYNFHFYTSFWYKPGRFPFTLLQLLPIKLRSKLEREFRKRYYEKIPSACVTQFPFFEFIREILDKFLPANYSEFILYFRDRLHDRWVSNKINDTYSIVIGYEECCINTFKAAKKKGITTVLDLAQIHYKEIANISNKFPVFSEIYINRRLRKRINKIKEEELQLADYIICLSEFAKNSLIQNGIPEQKVFVANLGFDPGKFLPKQEYINHGALRMVYAGTLTKRKGIDLLLKLKSDFKEKVELTFIGPMSDAKDLFQDFKEPYTHYEYLEHSEMNQVFRESDIFVFPSYLDSWAMVVVEAMGCGLPVIVTGNTGAKDALSQSNEAGIVIPTGDYKSLKDAVTFFINNRDSIHSFGRNAVRIATEYSWGNYYHQINKIISAIKNNKTGSEINK